jgi:hypothetical protein
MINSVCIKFPQEHMDRHADALFMPLVMRLINDDSRLVRPGLA